LVGVASAQAQEQKDEHAGHAMGRIPVVKPEFPRLGKAQEGAAGPRYRLEQLGQMALANNPTLPQAQTEIRGARARQQQSGLYPNPRAGYIGEEIRGGAFGGGQHGFFVSQTFVTAGKLGHNRKIFGHEVRITEIEAEEQRLRVLNGVRLAYYRVLAAQEMLETEKDLSRIAADSLKTTRQLQNVGQADETEVLQAEIEAQTLEMSVAMRENELQQAWRWLAAVVGEPELPLGIVEGNLAEVPTLEEDRAVELIAQESPAVKIAQAATDRAQATVERERREPIPDIEVRAGLQRNGELLEPMRRVGMQGFVEVGVQIPLFNRNQGRVEEARAAAERAQQETRRVELALRQRAAATLQMHRNARLRVERYQNELLPRAQRAYELMIQKYGLMLASYPQVLLAQRTLFHLQSDYIAALEEVWMNDIALRGLLLTDGLEAPARPGEIDMPVREINVPMVPRMMSREE
jgi:cobalt-zinc-cadmium efflux system outer membrane protein